MATVVGQSKDIAKLVAERKVVNKAFNNFFRGHFEVASFFEQASHTLLPYLSNLPVKPVALPTGVVSISELCVAVHVLRSPQDTERTGLAITVWLDPVDATIDATAEGAVPNLDASRVAMAHLVCAAASSAFAPEPAPYPGLFDDPETWRSGLDKLFEDIRVGEVGAPGVRNKQKAVRRKRGALSMLPFDPNARIVDYPGVDGDAVPPHAEILLPRLEKTDGLELDVANAPKRFSDAIEAQLKTILEAFGHAYVGSRKLASSHPDVARRRIGLRVGAKELLRDEILYDSEGNRLTAEEFRKTVNRDLYALKQSS